MNFDKNRQQGGNRLTKVIKRDCTEVDFQKEKISNAILKAMKNVSQICVV